MEKSGYIVFNEKCVKCGNEFDHRTDIVDGGLDLWSKDIAEMFTRKTYYPSKGIELKVNGHLCCNCHRHILEALSGQPNG